MKTVNEQALIQYVKEYISNEPKHILVVIGENKDNLRYVIDSNHDNLYWIYDNPHPFANHDMKVSNGKVVPVMKEDKESFSVIDCGSMKGYLGEYATKSRIPQEWLDYWMTLFHITKKPIILQITQPAFNNSVWEDSYFEILQYKK